MSALTSPTGTFKIRPSSVVLDCSNPKVLAQFYSALLDWPIIEKDPEWIHVRHEGGYPLIVFQEEGNFVPPTWPTEAGSQQQQVHMDFAVDNLKEAENHAISLGARKSPAQFSERWTVMFDPAGHTFCLVEFKDLK